MKRGVIIGVASVLIIAVAALFVIFNVSTPSPITAQIRQSVPYPLYSPKSLPEGWDTKPDSATVTDGVVIFVVNNPRGSVVITQQRRPPTFDFNSFYKQGLSGTYQVTTKTGSAYIGQANGKYIGSLVAGETWILASPNNSSVSQTDIQDVLKSLSD